MQIHVIDNGLFKLDGGAMFGVVPQSIWKKLNPPDNNNMCTWAMRSLLIEVGNSLTLIDTGIGDKQNEKFFSHYHLHGSGTLISSIQKAGFQDSDITNVFLTHLHFDHVGGAVSKIGETFQPTFTNANYWSNKSHWESATNPNPREKASFLKENILPLQESGQLKFVENSVFSLFDFIMVDGHTEKMMLPKIEYKNQTIVFVSDLIPSIGHIPLPYLMAYDIRPLLTMDEKKTFLQQAATNNWVLVFQHDPITECCTVKFSEKGVVLNETFRLSDI
jgi:glyoxylase-like metal-dependent hydrolase (beta-lactamase superfamily II)